jgi:hypothetical protein
VFAARGGAATEELGRLWARLGELDAQADADFPLDAGGVDQLLRGLRARLLAIYAEETAARDELRAILA